MTTLDCFYSLSSPWAYFGGPQLEGIVQRHGVRLGIFGAPTYVLDGERFWGQDRLAFVERALERRRAAG